MKQPDRAAADHARAAIAHLQQSVQALIDGDRLLPGDGSSLLATLDRALERLVTMDALAAWTGIEAFSSQVTELIEAGVLDAADGRPRIEEAAPLIALLRRTDAADLTTDRRQGIPPGDQAPLP